MDGGEHLVGPGRHVLARHHEHRASEHPEADRVGGLGCRPDREYVDRPGFLGHAPFPVAAPYAVPEWNRRAEHATATLVAAFLTWFVQMLIWTRDVVIPQARVRRAQAVEAGRVHAAAGLEALRERAFQLEA